MRIVHVIAGVAAQSGGPTEVLRQMTAELARRGHEVTVLTTDAAPGGRYRLGDPGEPRFHEAVRVRSLHALTTSAPYPSPAHTLASWRAAQQIDVAHVHGLFTAPVSLAMAAFRARRVPYILRPCGMLDAYSLRQRERLKAIWLRFLDRPNLLAADRVQASTDHEADALRALMPAHAHRRVIVLPQGVDAPPPPSGRRMHDRPYLLFLSRIARKKGLLSLVEAFAIVAAARSEIDLLLAGPDEAGHRAEVERAVRAARLERHVRLLGPVAGAEKADLFAGCEAFVLPSEDENFGVVVVEAAHYGAPLIVSEAVGLARAVKRLGAGHVTERTPSAIAAAILDALARGRRPFAAGLAALAAEHAWSELIPRLEQLYLDAREEKREKRR